MALDGSLIGESAGAIVSGNRISTDIAETTIGRAVPQWVRDMSINVSEHVAPLLALLEASGPARKVYNAKYNHLEDDELPLFVEISSFSTDGDGTGVVLASNHGKRVRVQTVLHVPRTGEDLLITAVSTDTITVTRGFGSTSATTLVTGEDMQIIGSAFEENSASPAGISNEPSIKTNYTQTHKVSVDLSGRTLVTEAYGGDELARVLKRALKHLNLGIEGALLHGAYMATTPTGTGGADHWISTNLTNVAGALTEATLNTIIKKHYRKNQGSGKQTAFIGELGLDALNGFGLAGVQYRQGESRLGVKPMAYDCAHGSIDFYKHGLFTVNADKAGLLYIFNMELVKLVELANRGFIQKQNVQTPDVDGRKDYFLRDVGLFLGSEKQHSKAYGITG